MRDLLVYPRFLLLVCLKTISLVFFSFTVEWVGHRPKNPMRDARIGLLLNHTSLFEPILMATLPLHWLWSVSVRGVLPGADITMNRPIAGPFFKFMVAIPVTVTRARDGTWREFLSHIKEDAVVVMSPEGRMKRPNGFDKFGKPMTMRTGVVDVLDRKNEGTLLLMYSGGLHHVQSPGEGFPRLFKNVKVRFEEIQIAHYKKKMGHGTPDFRKNVIADLESRRDRHCAWD